MISIFYNTLIGYNGVNLIFDGDSLTNGINNAQISQYYPKQVRDNLTQLIYSLSFYSFGVSGQSTLDMLQDIDSQILTSIEADKRNIVIIWEDVNAILNGGRTALENYNDFSNYAVKCKNAGVSEVILITGFYPRTPYNRSEWNTGNPTPLDIQHDYFELCKTQNPDGVDYVIDLRNIAEIGGGRSQAVNEYFADSVHLESIGYDLIANTVTDKLKEILDI